MKAVVVRQVGGPDVLTVVELPVPVPGDREVLVEVAAVGLNPVDCGNRQDATWAGLTTPFVTGYEFAGTVVAPAGDLNRGDQVWGLLPVRGTANGALAQLVAASLDHVARRPEELSLIESAALPLAGCTALQTMQRLPLLEGDWLLVHGAAGGVGHLVVQMAHRRGVRIAAATHPRDRHRLMELGLDLWLDRSVANATQGLAFAAGAQFDAAVDLVGGKGPESFPFVRQQGHFASIVDFEGPLDEAIDRNLELHGVLVQPGRQALADLEAEVSEGVRPRVVDVFPLEDVSEAHRVLEAGALGGKVVIAVDETAREESEWPARSSAHH